MKTYDLTYVQIQKLANLCKQEQGSVEGAKAEASLMANILETQSYYKNKYGNDIYSFARNSGWFSKAAYWMDNGDASSTYSIAIQDVLVNGNRTLPQFVDEHDCLADIKSATNNGKPINIHDRSAYKQDVTIIKNRYGSTYTFWSFPTPYGDPFGYTNKTLRWSTKTMVTVNTILNKAISYLGASEPTGDDQFIRYYNNVADAKFAMNVAWCAIFVTVVARMTGVGTDIIPSFADCDAGKNWFMEKKRFELSKKFGGRYTPMAGDIVFYSSKYKLADSTHVGYVVSCDGKTLKAIEGNKDDRVAYRTIDISSAYIIGYGRVAEFINAKTDGDFAVYVRSLYETLLKRTPTNGEVTSWVEVLKKGVSREEVRNDFLRSDEYKALHKNDISDTTKAMTKKFQSWLNSYAGLSLTVDGSCGPATKKAAVAAMQKYLNATYGAGLSVDGVFGEKTRSAFRVVKQGVRGPSAYIVQGLLYGHGYDPAGFDGSCGNGCVAAIREFQKNNNLNVDGKCGSKTFQILI